ncbi:MAG: hypothetical protein M1401_07970 [Chloroflexi bacterium]|nr:hypothetical protein [Chloroflexota bacterium]
MVNASWKQTERAIAKRLGGRRSGSPAQSGATATADVVAAALCCEVKHRRALPEWLKAALRQSVQAAGPGQLSLVVLHEAGERHDGDIVCLRLADFQALAKEPRSLLLP